MLDVRQTNSMQLKEHIRVILSTEVGTITFLGIKVNLRRDKVSHYVQDSMLEIT